MIMDGPPEDVAKRLIEQAQLGMLNAAMDDHGMPVLSSMVSSANTAYIKSCEIHHEPTHTNLTLTREVLMIFKVWHLSMSFSEGTKGLPFNPDLSAVWIRLVFGKWVQQLRPIPAVTSPNIKHYLLFSPGQEFVDLGNDR